MITEEKLAELREELRLSRNQTMMLCPRSFDVDEALDTLSALWRVARAAEKALNNDLQQCSPSCESDFVPLLEALAALREGKETR